MAGCPEREEGAGATDDRLEGSDGTAVWAGGRVEPGPLTGVEPHEWVEDLLNAGQLDRCRQH